MSNKTILIRCSGKKNDGSRCTREKEFPADEAPKEWRCWQHREKNKKPGGRPPEYETAEELQKAIDDYFESCFTEVMNEETGEIKRKQIRPFTITGLAYHLGLTRQGLLNYQHKNKEFLDTITRAKTKIEMYVEEQLFRSSGRVNGIIFNLKNNFKGWKDKQEHDLNHSGGVQIIDDIE